MRRASIREVIVQWHDYVVIELFEMNEDNIIDANEGLNEFDDDSYGPFLTGNFGLYFPVSIIRPWLLIF